MTKGQSVCEALIRARIELTRLDLCIVLGNFKPFDSLDSMKTSYLQLQSVSTYRQIFLKLSGN